MTCTSRVITCVCTLSLSLSLSCRTQERTPTGCELSFRGCPLRENAARRATSFANFSNSNSREIMAHHPRSPGRTLLWRASHAASKSYRKSPTARGLLFPFFFPFPFLPFRRNYARTSRIRRELDFLLRPRLALCPCSSLERQGDKDRERDRGRGRFPEFHANVPARLVVPGNAFRLRGMKYKIGKPSCITAPLFHITPSPPLREIKQRSKRNPLQRNPAFRCNSGRRERERFFPHSPPFSGTNAFTHSISRRSRPIFVPRSPWTPVIGIAREPGPLNVDHMVRRGTATIYAAPQQPRVSHVRSRKISLITIVRVRGGDGGWRPEKDVITRRRAALSLLLHRGAQCAIAGRADGRSIDRRSRKCDPGRGNRESRTLR